MHRKRKDFRFAKRAAAYDDGFEGRLSRKFYALLLEKMELCPGMAVLDVGCGTGALLQEMADTCDINGYGIDIEENMIAEAKQKRPEMNIQRSSCEAMPFDNGTFDVVTACMAYHHFADPEGFAKEAARITKKEGYLYIADVRFAAMIRGPVNAIIKHVGITAKFSTPQEVFENFLKYGYEPAGFWLNGYAQLVKLKKQ